MTDKLSTIPRIVFTQIEPLFLLAGFLGPLISPQFFIVSQLPRSSLTLPGHAVLENIVSIDPTATLLAWQLGNAYLLLGILGVFILNTTTELKVVQAYLLALWLGDIGHVALTLWTMGWNGATDISSWNAVVWGNIGFTVFVFLTRSLYFLRVFDDEELSTVKQVKETTKKGTRKTRND